MPAFFNQLARYSKFAGIEPLLALCTLLLGLACPAAGQQIPIPKDLTQIHPRVAADALNTRDELQGLLKTDTSMRKSLAEAESSLEPYMRHCKDDPMWMASRLQMYWKTHATTIYNRGDVFDHVDGHAPVPTVRFPGARDGVTIYGAPKIEDIPPFEDDTRGVYVVNHSLPGALFEWASPSKTGRVIDTINSNIMAKADTAAKIYWITGDDAYAKFAATLLDTYLTGMYYRNEPIDLNHGHSQTIYGMSTFEVIQEGILKNLASTYDFLYPYLKVHSPEKLPIYSSALKKWIDLTLRNGVPFNNWDLIQADFVIDVALVLEDDSAYADGKGRQYYLDQVLNQNQTRQWSLTKLANTGFDPKTGIWFESPGYSVGVVASFANVVNHLDSAMHADVLQQLPVVAKAVRATAQYLYPNGYPVAFGDSHYSRLSSASARQMVLDAQVHKRRGQEIEFTEMAKMLDDLNGRPERGAEASAGLSRPVGGAGALDWIFHRDHAPLDESVPAGKLEDFVTRTFSAPNVSYFVQRNGLDVQNGLMIAEAGSLGNHQHANGITMELYGKGVVLAPESGIGTSYFQSDYAEYYSQFPAHNTVVVDGISSYPTMKSSHGFKLLHSYPEPEVKTSIFTPLTYSDVYFLEPETNSDQRRLMSIVRTSETAGYYIDIFRSRRKDGHDKEHDYIYHGLGQSVSLTDEHGVAFPLQPTEKLTFANEELSAYDYFYDKRSVVSEGDFHAAFLLKVPGRDDVTMNMWMAGSPGREIFSVKAPPTRAYRNSMIPQDVADLPMPTVVVRQTGEAWDHPFVAVYEPVTSTQPTSIADIRKFSARDASANFVGIAVKDKTGDRQFILSETDGGREVSYEDIRFRGTYGVVNRASTGSYLFLGDGTEIADGTISLVTKGKCVTAALEHRADGWYFTSDGPVQAVIPARNLGKSISLHAIGVPSVPIHSEVKTLLGKTVIELQLPAAPMSRIEQ